MTVSLDGFGAGVACAFKNQKITFKSKLVIAVMAFIMMSAGNAVGRILSGIVPQRILPFFSSAVFLAMGIVTLVQSIKCHSRDYDYDRSEKIDGRESVMLGFSLDADCFLAGLAYGGTLLQGILAALCVAGMQSLFITVGELLVRRKCSKNLKGVAGGIISGLLFIFIAILQWV